MLYPVPLGEADVEIPKGLVVRLHEHKLSLELVARIHDTIRRFGPCGGYRCAACSRLRYGVVRYCAACDFAVCPECFETGEEEQKDMLGAILEDERTSKVQEALRFKRQKSLKRTSKVAGELTPIMQACVEGDCAKVKDIVDKDEFLQSLDLEQVADIAAGEHKGKTALILAAQHGHRTIVLLLIGRGASLEAVDNNGMTPLMHAAYAGFVEVLDELLFAGATIDRVAFCGYTALLFAANKGQEICCHRLLDASANAMARTPAGRTALIVAAFNGHVRTVQLLLRRDDVDVDCKDDEGYSARDAAIAAQRTHIEQLISTRLLQLAGRGTKHLPSRPPSQASTPPDLHL